MSADSEINLTSKDLEQLINSGNLNLENLDLLQMDPGTIQLLQQHSGLLHANPNLNQTAVTPRMQMPAQPRQAPRQPAPAEPYVEIVEQPKARGLRFRYECEGRSAGSIPGESSTTERKTFPTIKIHNYTGHAVIVVSCVTKDEPHKPHPHNLVGKDCKKGVCTLRIRDTNVISFPHLGIQCAKKKDVESNLSLRKDINVDPFQTGFKHKGQNIDLNVVRLCFQVFLPDENGKITRIVRPVVSQPIHDKKALNELIICRVDKTSGKAKGGDEVFLLCEKINRDDVRVRFFEENDGKLIWEAFGDFGQNDVHRQFAIVFRTPAYKDPLVSRPMEVFMQLWRPSDSEGSEAIQFTYMPEDPDPDRIIEKRKRKAQGLNFIQSSGGAVSADTIKQRLKLKATRTHASGRVKQEQQESNIKQEVASPDLPTYSFTNTGSQKSAAEFSSAMATSIGVTEANNSQMSGGTMQFSNSSVPAQPQVPSVQMNPQLAQLLAQAILSQSATAVSQQNGSAAPSNTQSIQMNSQEIIRQLLQGVTEQNTRGPNQDGADPNLQSISSGQNQEMSSLGSIDANLIQNYIGDSPMVSLEGLEFSGLSGNFDQYDQSDQTVAAFENVSSADTNLNQQQIDETTAAIDALSRN